MPSPPPNSAVRESAPYGHACVGCARAKCRCISRGTGHTCERCHRLGKECRPSTVIRKRAAHQPPPSRAKAARLEEKLDALVTLLQTKQATGQQQEQPQNSPEEPDGSHPQTNNKDPELENYSPESVAGQIITGQCHGGALPLHNKPGGRGASSPWAMPSPITPSEPPAPQANECLRTFRTCHLPFMPFVHLPPEVTPAELQRDRPFLWLNIRALGSRSIFERKAIEKEIRETLARSLVVDLVRSLDLLLGLIAYMNWALDQVRGKKLLCVYSSLAKSLVFDLRLERSTNEVPCKESDTDQSFIQPVKRVVPTTNTRTNEERRAALACYVTCSNVASFIKCQPMRWTPHLENSLQYLAKYPESTNDEVLVALVKIAKVMDDVNLADFERMVETETHGSSKVAPILHAKALVANLDTIRESLRPGLFENRVIRQCLYDTYMMVHHLPLRVIGTSGKLVGFGKSASFSACITAIDKVLEIWLSFSPREMFGLSMGMMLHFARHTHTLYRILAEDAEWDRSAVTSVIDLVHVLERAVVLIGAVPAAAQFQTDGTDFFSTSRQIVKNTIPVWKRAFAKTDPTMETDPEVANDQGLGGGDLLWMDFLDDACLPDNLTAWENY